MKSKIKAVIVKYMNPVKKINGIETVIVDNSPPKENLGFAKAVNIGVKKAISFGATKVLLLNPDIKINKKQILQLAKNQADIVSPVLKSNGVCDYGGKVNWWIGRTHHEKIASSPAPRNDISYVSGACMMIDKKVFEKIGFFDERFFMYFEDVDFCLRAKQAGFKISINTKITVDHLLTKNKQKNIFVLESNYKFINKWIRWYYKPFAYIYLLWLLARTLAFARDAETRFAARRASSA